MNIKKITINIFFLILAFILTVVTEYFVLSKLIESNPYIVHEHYDDVLTGLEPWAGCDTGLGKLSILLKEYKNKNGNAENIIQDKEIEKNIKMMEEAFCLSTDRGDISKSIKHNKINACISTGNRCIDSNGNYIQLNLWEWDENRKMITCDEKDDYLCKIKIITEEDMQEREANYKEAVEEENDKKELYNTFYGEGFSFAYPKDCLLDDYYIGYNTSFFVYNSTEEAMQFLSNTDYTIKEETNTNGIKVKKVQYSIHSSGRTGFMTIIPINGNKFFKVVFEVRVAKDDCSLEAYDLILDTFKID